MRMFYRDMPLLCFKDSDDRAHAVKLTRVQAEVLTLRRFDRMTVESIAKRRQADPRDVRRILARAGKRLKAAGVTLPPVPVMRRRRFRPWSLSGLAV